MPNQDFEVFCIAGIEAYVFGGEESPSAPVVFVTHGRMGEVAHVFGYCRDLRAMGLVAVGVEQRNHGRRLLDGACNGGWGRHHAADMYGLFLGTALDISLLIDLLPARAGIAMERVGVTGVSLGGHAALMAMGLDPRIGVGAAMIGSGDYRRLMETRAAANNCPPEAFREYFPAALEDTVRKFDPINHPDYFADRPLLMLNGTDDTLVPTECNVGFERVLRPWYSRPERLKLSMYEGIGHAVPAEMWAETRDWLRKWLLHDGSSTAEGER